MALSIGTVLHQRYRIVKEVGRGGFGAVYRAWDMSLEQPVAVKENAGAGPDAARQFEREAKLLAGLKHPNLPRVLDHFVLPGQGQYLVMDFVEGTSLFDILQKRGRPLTEAEALPWIRQVCSALAYLHTRTPPVIHRDIKPDNIILTTDGQAMLVDFGISKVYDANNPTTLGAKAVTPGYSPLEQYGRGKTEARSDVYALGATLYTLLSGQTPPEAPDLASRAETLRPLHQLNPAVSMSTSTAVSQAMAMYVEQRPDSIAAFEWALYAPPPPAASPMPATAPVRRQAPPPPVAPNVQQPAHSAASGGAGGSHASSLGCVLVAVGAFLAMALIVVTSGLVGLMIFLGSWLLSALVIYIVGRLNLGLTVSSFMAALTAAAVIAIVSWLITWLLGPMGVNLGNSTLIRVIVSLIVAAIVLMISDRFVAGMAVNGFVGALIAAVAVAVVVWLVIWILGLLGFYVVDANPTTTLVSRTLF